MRLRLYVWAGWVLAFFASSIALSLLGLTAVPELLDSLTCLAIVAVAVGFGLLAGGASGLRHPRIHSLRWFPEWLLYVGPCVVLSAIALWTAQNFLPPPHARYTLLAAGGMMGVAGFLFSLTYGAWLVHAPEVED